MNVGSIVERWKQSGTDSVKLFNLSNHYSVLFEDDDGGGFDYIFNHLDVDKDKLLKSENEKVIGIFDDIDDGMYQVSHLIEDFITEYLWGNDLDVEDVKSEIGNLRLNIEEAYGEIFSLIHKLKEELEEGILDEKV